MFLVEIIEFDRKPFEKVIVGHLDLMINISTMDKKTGNAILNDIFVILT